MRLPSMGTCLCAMCLVFVPHDCCVCRDGCFRVVALLASYIAFGVCVVRLWCVFVCVTCDVLCIVLMRPTAKMSCVRALLLRTFD